MAGSLREEAASAARSQCLLAQAALLLLLLAGTQGTWAFCTEETERRAEGCRSPPRLVMVLLGCTDALRGAVVGKLLVGLTGTGLR